MSRQQANHDEQIERWVREALQRREEGVDAEALVAAVHNRLAGMAQVTPIRPTRTAWGKVRFAAVRIAVAAAVLLAVLVTVQMRPKPVSAETLVQQALTQVKQDPSDRCYTVEAVLTGKGKGEGEGEGDQFLQIPKQSRLWTRGDRFVMEFPPAKAGDGNFKSRWGRDENGQVWIIPAPNFPFRFEAKDLQTGKGTIERLRSWSELYAMNVETLLDDVLANYDLEREPGLATIDGHKIQVIHATVKPHRANLAIQKARLELDQKTNLLRRVVVFRKAGTVTFTLEEIRSQPDSHYQLATYVTPEGQRFLAAQEALARLLKGRPGNNDALAQQIMELIEALKKHR